MAAEPTAGVKVRLLFVAPNVPAAHGKGYQVRLYHQLLGLAGRHELHLIALTAPHADISREFSGAAVSVELVERGTRRAAVSILSGAKQYPLSVALFRDSGMSNAIRHVLRRARFDLVHFQLVRSVPYLDHVVGIPTVLDLLDAAGLNMRERARVAPAGIRQMLELEAQRLSVFERRALSLATLGLVISERDRDELGGAGNVRVNPNGVDLPDSTNLAARDPATVTFSGTMSYPPNADAASWFVSSVLPFVRRVCPEVKVRIVGRAPGRAVAGLARVAGVTVTGEVPSVHEELCRAAVAVCPVRYGSGVQTKILEAMAAGAPVVATGTSAAGLEEPLRRHVLVADGAEQFATAVTFLLQDPSIARARARAALEELQGHTWQRSLDQLERYYAEARRLAV